MVGWPTLPVASPLPRSLCVVQGLTHRASGSLVRRSGSDLTASRLRPRPSSPGALPGPITGPVCSLLRLHISLGAPGFLPGPDPAPSPKRYWLQPWAPLLRFLAPSALEDRCVHHPRPYLSRFVPTSPFLTTSPVYSASNPSRDLPGWHSWGFLPYRVVPVPTGTRPSPVASSPRGVVSAARLSAGSGRSLRQCCVDAPSGCCRSGRPFPLASGFPSARDRPPLGLFFWTSWAIPCRSSFRSSCPVTIPNCERATPCEEETRGSRPRPQQPGSPPPLERAKPESFQPVGPDLCFTSRPMWTRPKPVGRSGCRPHRKSRSIAGRKHCASEPAPRCVCRKGLEMLANHTPPSSI